MEIKLTEEEIIKTLECCSEDYCNVECPLRQIKDCEKVLCINALDLIRKLKGGAK